LINRIEEIARTKGCLPAQLAIAWLLAQGDDIVPIPGSKTIKHLKENIKALDIKLTTDELEQIDQAAPRGFIVGAPYPEAR
jgi:aryl-alcohol dehydrogenase-like predicted oxidoreductase